MKLKKLNILLWKMFKHIPKSIRGPVTRSLFKIDFASCSQYSYKVADTFEEVIGAMELVQDIYKKNKMTSDDALIRASKFNLLPTTHIFIAKNKLTNEIVATVSIIQKTSIGLPVENYYDIKEIIANGFRSGEISALSVKDAYRSRSTGIFLALTIYCVQYSYEVLGIKHFFISVRDSVKNFYEDIFAFHQIGKSKVYENVGNLKSAALHFFYPVALEEMKQKYKNTKLSKNVFELYTNSPWRDQSCFKRQKYNLVSKFFLTDMELSHLLQKKNDLLLEIPKEDLQRINEIYFHKKNFGIFIPQDPGAKLRRHPRFCVNQKAKILANDKIQNVEVIEVSKRGVMLISPLDISLDQIIKISVNIENNQTASLNIQAKWRRNNLYGFEVISKNLPDEWTQMVTYFEDIFESKVFEETDTEQLNRAS